LATSRQYGNALLGVRHQEEEEESAQVHSAIAYGKLQKKLCVYEVTVVA